MTPLIETLHKRAERWKRDQGEIGYLLYTEINCIIKLIEDDSMTRTITLDLTPAELVNLKLSYSARLNDDGSWRGLVWNRDKRCVRPLLIVGIGDDYLCTRKEAIASARLAIEKILAGVKEESK